MVAPERLSRTAVRMGRLWMVAAGWLLRGDFSSVHGRLPDLAIFFRLLRLHIQADVRAQ